MISGFRLGPAGAQGRYGVAPDLTTLGKVIGGGLPVGAVGGRAEVMDVLAPLGPVYQAGTLSGNPLATAAGLAALGELTDDVYRRIEAAAARLADGLRTGLDKAGIEAVVTREGTLVGLFLGTAAPTDYDGARGTDEATYGALFHALLARDVAIAPGAYEVLFPGLAHTDAVLDDVAERVADAAAAVAAGRPASS